MCTLIVRVPKVQVTALARLVDLTDRGEQAIHILCLRSIQATCRRRRQALCALRKFGVLRVDQHLHLFRLTLARRITGSIAGLATLIPGALSNDWASIRTCK